jgi:hypothetical protein
MTKEYKYNTYKEALDAVKGDGGKLRFVRPDLITYEMALEAVKDRGWGLEHVPANCQTKEVIEAALKHDPSAKHFIKVKGLMEALDEDPSETH